MEPTTETPVRDAPQQAEPVPRALPPASDRDLRWQRIKEGNPRFRVALIIGAIVLLIAVFFVWRYLGSYESTDDAQIDGHIGSISARVSGHVQKLLVEDNQYVQAGTPLVVIDPQDYQVALDTAKAAYADAAATAQAAEANVPITTISTGSQTSTAEASVDSARAGISVARQQLDAARAQVAQAEANNVKAQNDLQRYKQLVDKQEISRQQYDQAVAAATASAGTLDAAHATARAAEHEVTQAQSKLAEAQANLRSTSSGPQQVASMRAHAQAALAAAAQKKAQLQQAELNLQYATIIAPVSGIVSDRTVEVGQNVSIGQELMKVIPLDDIWVTANFKENQLRDMKVGQPVSIEVDAYGRTYKGHVQSIAGASGARFSLLPPENATGNYVKVVQRLPVKITLDPDQNKDHLLRPGMSVEPKVWLR